MGTQRYASVVRCSEFVVSPGAACPRVSPPACHQTPGEESRVFEPQGTGFFLLLLVVFGGLLIWVALARQLVFRVFAGCLAFLPAMASGVAAVNKFYDYYQTWGGMVNDLTGQGVSSIPKYAAPGAGTNKQFDTSPQFPARCRRAASRAGSRGWSTPSPGGPRSNSSTRRGKTSPGRRSTPRSRPSGWRRGPRTGRTSRPR